MKKVKVLHVVESHKIGGLEGVIANIAEGLNKQKYGVSVWCVARGGKREDNKLCEFYATKT